MARPKQNLLLAKLPTKDRGRLLPDLEHVHLELGQPAYKSDKEQSHVYFLTDRREFQRSGQALQQSLLRYTQALLTQMAQTAVCNRHRHRPAILPLAAADP